MKENLRISIVVVCYNEKENIAECVESLLAQDYPQGDYEVIVVDNDSTDGTKEIVDKYAGNRLKLIINPVKGIAESRNIGVDKASFDRVAFIDADCIAPKDWLSLLADGYKTYREANDKLAAVGGSNIPPEENLFYRALRVMLETYIGSRGSVQGMVFDSDREVSHLPCVNALYDKSKIREINGFDERFRDIGEDQDLTFRLKKRGFRF